MRSKLRITARPSFTAELGGGIARFQEFQGPLRELRRLVQVAEQHGWERLVSDGSGSNTRVVLVLSTPLRKATPPAVPPSQVAKALACYGQTASLLPL